VICRLQKLHTQLTFRLCLVLHEPVDIEPLLLLQNHVMHNHLSLLADANCATDRLVHESRSPPGARKDDALKVLQIQTRATRLELDEQNLVLASVRIGGLLKNSRPLTRRKAAVIEPNSIDLVAEAEKLLEQLHLLVEVAEDDPLLGLTVLLDEIADSLELCARVNPVRARIERRTKRLSASLNVDLRVKADLAKTHDELELVQSSCTSLICESPEAPLDISLDTAIEVSLVLRIKIEDVRHLDLLLRKVREDGAHLLHASRQHIDAKKRGVVVETQHLEEGVHVTGLVNDRCRSQKPVNRALNLLDQSPARTLVRHAVSLVANDAVPGPIKQVRILDRGLIVDKVEVGRAQRDLRRRFPGTTRCNPAIDPRLCRRRAPLLENGQGAEEEIGLESCLLQKADHLNCLTESHLIAEESSAMRRGCFSFFHPTNTSNLVLLIHESIPEGSRHCVGV